MRPAMLVLAAAPWLACAGGAPGAPASGAGPASAPGPAGGAADPAGGAAPAISLALERLDDAGDCAGLVPAEAPAAVSVQRAAPGGAACLGGTSDGTGAVAIGAREASGVTTWQAYAPDGAPRAAFAADAPLVPAPAGWQALVASAPPGSAGASAALVTFAPDGTAARTEAATPAPDAWADARWSLGRDPAGGALVAVRASTLAGNHWSAVTAQRFGAGGEPRWPAGTRVRSVPSATDPLFLGGAVCASGEALVLSQRSSALDVSWLDPATGAVLAGASADAAEPLAGVVGADLSPALELVPLLDGSLAVRADGTFRRIYRHLATASAPLPAWLAERAASTLRVTRGGLGYAALPPPGRPAADCAQRVDLLSASGRLCGRVVLREAGTACTTGALDQGWDGTLVQQSGKDACLHRFWPRLLAR